HRLRFALQPQQVVGFEEIALDDGERAFAVERRVMYEVDNLLSVAKAGCLSNLSPLYHPLIVCATSRARRKRSVRWTDPGMADRRSSSRGKSGVPSGLAISSP
ncbi:MAG: hypothetical protein M3P30_15510, partial [Chloroflexota bacterium]|nr:hypothetical protein [Chloroflexota bacterium]